MGFQLATVKPGSRRSRAPSRVDALVCALTALTLGLGLIGLGSKSLWLDEALSVKRATELSVWTVLSGRGGNMGLYYAVLHFWIRVFGESEAAIRSLSAIFAALCVPALYLVGRRLFDRRAGVLAAVLLVPNALFLQWAQQARSYSLLILLVTLSCYFFLGELQQPSWANAGAYVLSTALAVDAHYFAIFVVVAQLLSLLALRGRAAFTWKWAGIAVALGLLSLPEVIHALHTGSGPISWIPGLSPDGVRTVLYRLAGSSWLALAILFTGCAVALVRAGHGRAQWREWFLAAWLAVPVILALILSFVQPMFLARYLVVCLPALVLLATRGLTRLPLPAFVAVFAAVACASGLRASVWYGSRSQEEWRRVTDYVLASARSNDAIVFYPHFAQIPFQYYEQHGDRVRLQNASGRLLRSASTPRLWLVIAPFDPARTREVRALRQVLGSRYGIPQMRSFSGSTSRIEVALYIRTLSDAK